MRKIASCACAGNAGNVFHTIVGLWSRHVSRCDAHALMYAGIANIAVSFEVGGEENVPGIPGACATRNLSIW